MDDGTVHDTHLIEQILEEREMIQDTKDELFITHFLSSAFINSSNSTNSPVEVREPANKVISEGNVFFTNVSCIYLSNEASKSAEPGFLVDIGAPRSVVGKKSLTRILALRGAKTQPERRTSNSRFRFADETFSSVGVVVLYLKNLPGLI